MDTATIEMMKYIPSPARLGLFCTDLAKPRKMETSMGAVVMCRGSMRHKEPHVLTFIHDPILHLFRVYCFPFYHWSFYQRKYIKFPQILYCVFISSNWIQVLVKYIPYSREFADSSHQQAWQL